MFSSLSKKYFDAPLSQGFVCLYIARMITNVSLGLLGFFVPIFLYNLFGESFQKVALYYGLNYFLYALTVFIGGKFLNRFGFKKSLQISVLFAALYYVFFYYLAPENIWRLVPLAVLALLCYRIFHWLPYHVDFAKFTNKRNRARQVSMFGATSAIIGIITPLIAGLIIVRLGFQAIFLIAVVLYLSSGIPYLVIPQTKEKFSWSFKKTWQMFLSKKMRRVVLANMAHGANSTVGFVVWPIFIFQLLKGNYFEVGALSTLITAFTVIIRLVLGKNLDLKRTSKKFLWWGSCFYALGWIIKIFISTAFHIFVAGLYHNITSVFVNTSWGVLNYELAADQGHYVDEFTVLREMAISFGKALVAAFIIIVSLYLSIQWVFVLAALMALIYNLAAQEEEKRLIVRFGPHRS